MFLIRIEFVLKMVIQSINLILGEFVPNFSPIMIVATDLLIKSNYIFTGLISK